MSALRLLFVDFAPIAGGSVQSLLLILRHLPRSEFQPILLLSPGVAALPAVQALGLPTYEHDAGQGRPIPFRAATAQARNSGAAGHLRRQGWSSGLWQWGSIGRRLWLRTRGNSATIARLIDQEQIDLLHLNDALPLAEPGILAAWRKRRPSLVFVRSFTPLDPFHRLISRLPAAGVFTSAALRQDQRDQGARFRREILIANAIDLAAYAQPPDRMGVRREFALPDQARILVVAGRIMRRKGLHLLIQALAQVATSHPDLHALIIGEDDPAEPGVRQELAAQAQALGLAQRIHFTGFRPDIPRLFLATDLLYFVPSEPEPFGRTVIEGMAAGLPVVAAASGALPDILGEGGLLVSPGDVAAQAAAIAALLDHPAQAAAFAAAGKARAAAHFSSARQIEQLCALYTGAAATKR